MKRQTTLAMFGILFAAVMALGMISVSGFSQHLFVASTDTKLVNYMSMMGHITFTATDQDGNIFSYIQTDNVIVNTGENCTAESLFNVTTSDSPDSECLGMGSHTGGNGVADGGFVYIAMSNGTTAAEEDDTNLALPEIDRQKDTIPTVVSSTGTGAGSIAVVTVDTVFTADEVSTISESGIFDTATENTGNMLARQTFDGIPLTVGDKLTIQWDITIGTDTQPQP